MSTAVKALLALFVCLIGGFTVLYCELFGCRQLTYFSSETSRMEQYLAALRKAGGLEIERSSPCRQDLKTGLYHCRFKAADSELRLGESLSEKKLISITSPIEQGRRRLHSLMVMANCDLRSQEEAEMVIVFLEREAAIKDQSKSSLYKIGKCGLSMHSDEIWMTPDYLWRFDAESAVPVPAL